MHQKLTGQVALVTGGSRGMGAAIAVRLAADGADVAFSYAADPEKGKKTLAAIEATGRRGLAVKADQADPRRAQHLVRQVADHFGRLDILVNNAGVHVTGTVDAPDRDQSAFDRQLAINLQAVVSTVVAAAPLLTEGGRIVSIASNGSATTSVPFPGLSDYLATKAAVVTYTKGWARDLAPRGITVNAIQPGAIDTDMNPADAEDASFVTSLTPMGRFGRPEEIAAAVSFLVGPEAAFITGASLPVDGGFSC
ncbi:MULTISPECIES: SDR family NAD(P)-dependent oxidoreductase [unclassified Streptomyces]|uniref:SDR family NAD(P)-dependent oxidoreductase n=1 Tax=unclassified Streptomyces TaxID=2593676 RepID=UPI002DDA6231|nr:MULTISPECIES: SDR family oxidoreductase [unclassified Streptomyces]WSF84572.1 SDR family oxidoreductase [Streptomyces sp. NBC_01744]WSC39140.1 SDR family oxidoreductase [Streptomyces sp. NBC_01763]WSC47278.1 SDR family oxidoreductase [Streptomyces sp. NBC_01762]WSC53733.1 SDR family oxidoreductase [Streptomyces sp. NBC_01761]WSD26933.1 SDR family oxidoreductase [Streptomyces sp. NBC_01751]